MTNPRKIYWDTCAWISLIKRDPDRIDCCESVIQLARLGEAKIWTSTLTLVEAFKWKGVEPDSSIAREMDQRFEDYLQQEFVVVVQVDTEIASVARRLRRSHAKLKKCSDAIHLATAVVENVDEMHTYDDTDLLPLDGKVAKANKSMLLIRQPPKTMAGVQPDLFIDQTQAEPASDDTDESRAR